MSHPATTARKSAKNSRSPAPARYKRHVNRRRPLPDLSVAYAAGDPGTLTVAGELDIATAPALREALLNALRDEGPAGLVVDVSGVTFVDSTGLAVLLMGSRRFAADERTFLLRKPSAALSRVMDLTGVRPAFEVEA